jgi:hypothetical protein
MNNNNVGNIERIKMTSNLDWKLMKKWETILLTMLLISL